MTKYAKLLATVAAALAFSVGYADDEIAQKSNTQSMTGSVDCSMLNQAEQNFASNLTDMNKMLFCNKFNASQRNTAITMAHQKDNTGKPMMTPDQSVMKVAKDNNIMNSSTMPSKGSNCSAK